MLLVIGWPDATHPRRPAVQDAEAYGRDEEARGRAATKGVSRPPRAYLFGRARPSAAGLQFLVTGKRTAQQFCARRRLGLARAPVPIPFVLDSIYWGRTRKSVGTSVRELRW